MKRRGTLGLAAAVLGASAVLSGAGVGVAAASGPSTVCTAAGLPDKSIGVAVPHVINATVNTCGAEKTPPTPPCSFAIDQAGLLHVKVYACAPPKVPTSLGVSASPTSLLDSGTTTPPPDCGPVIDMVIAGEEIFGCAASPSVP